uniref:MHC class I-like antigen recognition-like domain-containing protein n=1 Tax=Terrapene triunguis TaxID=2587831 RepID=A0A674J2K0_9SAUR
MSGVLPLGLLLILSCVSGFHIIQMKYGCDLREDNTTWGFYQDSYDGRDFLTFDKETMTLGAADIGAQITKRRWDAEVFDNQQWKRYLEERCIPWLRSSLEYGKETLQRKGKSGDKPHPEGHYKLHLHSPAPVPKWSRGVRGLIKAICLCMCILEHFA